MTEKTTRLSREERRTAKVRLVEAMEAGHSWQEAVELSGLAIGRSTAYTWWRRVRREGNPALDDGRHGHASKLCAPVRHWLVTYCEEHPDAPSRVVQRSLHDRFGVTICIGYLNQVRAEWGLSYRPSQGKKR
jgi:transposase